MRDLTATIHASVQQWNIVHLHGLSVLKAITGTKYDDGYPEELETLCENLANDCDKFVRILLLQLFDYYISIEVVSLRYLLYANINV